jgi:glutaredoxin
MADKQLILYGRDECHLCHDMLEQLRSIQNDYGFRLEIVDIDKHADLLDKYGALVPVLVHDSLEICHYFLDLERLRAVLGN